MKKPAYKLPSMKEIAEKKWNGYTVASTFSGCGGSCLGYRMAGYKVAYALEFIPEAQKTYKKNHPNSFLDSSDIRNLNADQLLERSGLKKRELDILDGSPPCSAFSTAGSREKGWGKVKNYSDGSQRVDDLFFEYARILEGVQPKIFIAENVTGLVKGTSKGYFKKIIARLRSCGYKVGCKIIDASWLGVPQSRQRTIFIGVRDDIGLLPSFPKPLNYWYSVGEAVLNVPSAKENEIKFLTKGSKTANLWAATKPGNPLSTACNGKISHFTFKKLSPDTPSKTITATCQHLHWSIARYMTIPEIKRICSFPDDFELSGNFLQRFERCGRAVPPLMMREISNHVEKSILNKI